jgi:hypothetical protein
MCPIHGRPQGGQGGALARLETQNHSILRKFKKELTFFGTYSLKF